MQQINPKEPACGIGLNGPDMTNQVVIHDAVRNAWLHFHSVRHVIEADCIEEVEPKLRLVETMVREKGLHAAGFISYEAAPAFDEALRVRPLDSFPLLWFGIYPPPETLRSPLPSPGTIDSLPEWAPSVSGTEYDRAIMQIKEHIARGETYQVNYTFRMRAPFADDAWSLFLELVHAQQAEYAAYVDTGRYAVCSASPELFFRLDGHRLTSRPMKGTAARGLTLAEDNAMARWLYHSEKNRAENVMIVDMVRNDMGRIAETGTVRVTSLFDIERYPTLWQMTSSVASTTESSLCDIMACLFPCASITGAPKPSTMRIIARLETLPRRIYTGCIGFITPDRNAQFNVAIRTVLIDRETARAEYGVGGGIMWDSASGDEYRECRVKALVLTKKRPAFSLLETMLWSADDGYFLLPYHLRRLHDSAAYFGFPVDTGQVEKRLTEAAASLSNGSYKVRLLVARDGAVSCRATPLDSPVVSTPARLRLAPSPVDSQSPFLYHKTTHRRLYDSARAACPDCDDVLLWNERGEVTETSISNIVVEIGGELVTPPVSSGLLPGTFRAWLLDRSMVRERIVKVEELAQIENLYLVNSVRRWRKAVLITERGRSPFAAEGARG